MELRRYWEIIRRRRWIFIQAVGIIVGTALLASFLMTPIYKMSAKIMIDAENLQAAYFSPALPFQLPMHPGRLSYVETRNVVDTYIVLLKSTPIIAKVTRELKLRDRNGKLIEVKDFVISIPRFPKLLIMQKKGVRIRQIRASEVLEITGYSTNREEAARIANAVAHSFLDFLSELYRAEASSAKQIIEKHITELEKKLNLAEEAEKELRIREMIIDLDTQVDALIIELSRLETEKNIVDKSVKEASANLTSIKKTLKRHPEFYKTMITLETNRNIEEYKNHLFTSETTLAGLLTEHTPEHPEVKSVKNRIETAKKAIRHELSKTFASEVTSRNTYVISLVERYGNTEIDIVKYSASQKMLSQQIAKKNRELAEIPRKRKQLTPLSMEFDILQSRYIDAKTQLEFTKMVESIDIANAVIVQQATPSFCHHKDIYFPQKTKIIVMSLLLAIPFGVFLTFLLEYLDDRIRTAKDVAEKLNQPVLGIIPKVKKGSLKRDMSSSMAEFLESFWDLRSNIKIATLDKDYKILSITSATEGEGKSTISKYLASTLAEADQKVLLVDLNLRRPHLHRMFNLSNSTGVTDFLEGKAEIKDIVLPTAVERVYLIPSGPRVTNLLKIIDSPNMPKLIQLIKQDYDLTIFDTPAIKDGSDVPMISSYSDNVIFLVASGYISEDNLKGAMEVVEKRNANILGVVLNIK